MIKRFYYNHHDDDREFVGVTAQEVLTKKPKAVVKLNTGYYAVDYSQIDVDFKEVA